MKKNVPNPGVACCSSGIFYAVLLAKRFAHPQITCEVPGITIQCVEVAEAHFFIQSNGDVQLGERFQVHFGIAFFAGGSVNTVPGLFALNSVSIARMSAAIAGLSHC